VSDRRPLESETSAIGDRRYNSQKRFFHSFVGLGFATTPLWGCGLPDR
jgi:hypothetical protein